MIDKVTGTKGHMKKKKTSSLSPSSRHSLRSIQLQDLIDHSEQMVNYRTADQLLLSIRVSEEDRHTFLSYRQTKCRQHNWAEATEGFSHSELKI